MDMECSSKCIASNAEDSLLDHLYRLDWSAIQKWLNCRYCFMGDNSRFEFSEKLIHILLRIIETCGRNFMWYNCLEAPIAETLTDVLKFLRLYVTHPKVADYIIKQDIFYEQSKMLISNLFTKKNGPELHSKYLLQLFLNLLCAGDDQQQKYRRSKVRDLFYSHNFFLMFYEAYGHVYEVSALLYNIYCDVELRDSTLVNKILKYHADEHHTNEYFDFLVQKIISQDFVWQKYDLIAVSARAHLLYCVRELAITNYVRDPKIDIISEACIMCLMKYFNKSANVVFQTAQKGDAHAIEEASCILELLAHVSSEEEYLPLFQDSKDVLINASVLLINAHRLGQSMNSVFTPIQKLAEVQSPSFQTRRNPVFGFKADLVRLIGNICWKNKKMQDLARESEVIPVLLDCCNIDAKNPFIMQWVILAIRNLCENNFENQQIIVGLKRQGVVSSEVLDDFGITLHVEDDLSIRIGQLDLSKR